MKKSYLIFPIAFLFLFSTSISAQIKHFKGNWTKLGTTYDFSFDLYLRHTEGNQVEGVFNWKFVHYNENEPNSRSYYEEKRDLTAKEFVRGTYNPQTKELHLRGYKKEDPHLIIGIDEYRLKVDDNGDIGGKTKAHGSWKGRVNGRAVRGDSA